MIQFAFLPVSVLVLVLELGPVPGPPIPALGAVLAPLALGHSPALSKRVIAVAQTYSVDGNCHSPSVEDASHVPFAPG